MPVVLELPDELRGELKAPFGPVYADAETLLAAAGEPVVAVGDIVTYHLLGAGRTPDVALIDRKTEREAVDEEVRAAVGGFDVRVEIVNPAATITDELLAELRAGLDRQGRTLLVVTDGEEDLAALPAIVAAPRGAAVVYGQPGEGMVLATVDAPLVERVRSLLARMDGDLGALEDVLAVQIE